MPDGVAREIFESARRILLDSLRLPSATYRVQFNREFKFSQAREIVSYLHELGISDLYASPYYLAARGSLSGYDILNPHLLNPEIGTEEDFRGLTEELARRGMGQILDIVPNHMCIIGENPYWLDVLENGPSSPFADFFDVDWKPVKSELENKVLLPILGEQYGEALEKQELILAFSGGAFFIGYGDLRFPLDPSTYGKILKFRAEELAVRMGEGNPEFQELLSILTALEHLPGRTEKDGEKILERRREKEIIKKRILALTEGSGAARNLIEENLRSLNGEKGNPRSFDALDEILKEQAYRFSHWRVAIEEINYRRFFDINDLAALRMERLPVFQESHQLTFQLVREKKVTGLRVDHPDGLYNPAQYFYRLQKACFIQSCLRLVEKQPGRDGELEGELEALYDRELFRSPSTPLSRPFFIVGEKILTKNERLPEEWPIFGTVGYEFLNLVNGVFVDPQNARAFTGIYNRFTRTRLNFPELVYEKKKLIMQASLSGEVNSLAHRLNRLTEKDRHTRDFTLNSLRTAISEVIACFPIYRTYVNECGVVERDRRYIEQAVGRARRTNPALSGTIFDFLKRVLLLQFPPDFTESEKEDWLDLVMRFQQVTGPVMAKGLEDTVFYIYNRLISLNEVGGNPEKFGIPLDVFHGQNLERNKSWPQTLAPTSTHDTKRSEDVRARLNVLSEIPEEWRISVVRWARMNKRKKALLEGQEVPDRNEEYLLYQTLLGAWPLKEGENGPDGSFARRIKDYMLKAVREAKVHSSWISPNTPYEEALLRFIDTLLAPSPGNAFRQDVEPLRKKVSFLGMLNSLSQTLLKITVPGVPDFYQGTELWQFTLVDPDNRRPVDFRERREILKSLREQMEAAGEDLSGLTRKLLEDWTSGAVKMYLILQSLNFRRRNHLLFSEGEYIPLDGEGDLKGNVCAFARRRGGSSALVAVPRFLNRLAEKGEALPLGEVWGDSWIGLPPEIPEQEFRDVFTGRTIQVRKGNGGRSLLLSEVFSHFPAGLLTNADFGLRIAE